MRPTTIAASICAAALIIAGTPARGGEVRTHDDEVTFFANTMAIAKTVKESCPGIEPDDRYLEALRLRLHVEETDHAAFAPKARAAADALLRARDDAPSRKAWCDAVFRLYGPSGKLMRGMLRRW